MVRKQRGMPMAERDLVERVIRSMRFLLDSYSRNRADAGREPEFSCRNGSRMRWRALQAPIFPTGSNITEAAYRSVVTKWFKGSGMRCSMIGGQAIMTFRA